MSLYSVIIPAFNEEKMIGSVLSKLLTLKGCGEIIVIDDGSCDSTATVARSMGVRVIVHPMNRGYGAALKTGIKNAKFDLVVWCDADGQHQPEDIERIVAPVAKDEVDACFGMRERGSAYSLRRLPGKLILKVIAQFVARREIPDLNCGLRCFKTNLVRSYLHLLPNGFSASSTTTILMIKRGYRVSFCPIKTKKREGGVSSVKMLRDGINTVALILRVMVLFDSFVFFSLLAALQIFLGGAYSIYEIMAIKLGVPVLGAIVIISGVLTFFMGLIASLINELRMAIFEMHKYDRT